ncbi:DUF997 family protein [Aliagarivorans taiwanensis]|uniref:DUF997 family protein n=1 Tax=Aliagarivorans taiwanensis TaxID=561966 RepID=UPI0003FB7996|nr:DUF997 family protein [Aliagarivorans taiwanensis]
MHGINPTKLALGAIALTLGYVVVWLAGPLLLADAPMWLGLPLWFWLSCIVAPIAFCLIAAYWLRERGND